VSAVAPLVGDSVKSLGAGAYLVTALPSAVLVLSTVALVTSRLYPWAEPVQNAKHEQIAPGLASVTYTVGQLGVSGAIVLTLLVVAGSVLLRPFQIVFVQLLEGYWRGGRLYQLRVSRHLTRYSIAATRVASGTITRPRTNDADEVARFARQVRKRDALKENARDTLNRYPAEPAHMMPTSLGNVLRMAETHAGDRYGLSTPIMFPRLYPFISARLDGELREQTNVLDSASVFTLLFTGLSVCSSPLIWRLDGWSFVPLAMIACAGVAYRGACTAALNVAQQQATAFDLHRFEMLAALRQRLPRWGSEEHEKNEELIEAIIGAAEQLSALEYVHHDQTTATPNKRWPRMS
jgi:hypothetical protein